MGLWEYIGFSRSEFHPDTFAVAILVIYLRIIKKYHIEEEKLILGHWHTGFVVKDLDLSIRFNCPSADSESHDSLVMSTVSSSSGHSTK